MIYFQMQNKMLAGSLLLVLLSLGACDQQESQVSLDEQIEDLRKVSFDDEVEYVRHEFHHEPQSWRGDLLSMVYDVPYFSGCGVFPPVHVINAIFASGGGDGGMSPGASWEPFTISPDTYLALADTVRTTDPSTLRGKSRYHHIKFVFDSEFDAIEDRFAWATAACDKYRDWYLAENAKLDSRI